MPIFDHFGERLLALAVNRSVFDQDRHAKVSHTSNFMRVPSSLSSVLLSTRSSHSMETLGPPLDPTLHCTSTCTVMCEHTCTRCMAICTVQLTQTLIGVHEMHCHNSNYLLAHGPPPPSLPAAYTLYSTLYIL